MKALFVMASVAALVAVSPVLAQEKMDKMMDKMSMDCTDADMAAMDTKMKSMTDADKQKMVMGEMDMAKKMMANKDMDRCKMHMNKAMDSMHMMTK